MDEIDTIQREKTPILTVIALHNEKLCGLFDELLNAYNALSHLHIFFFLFFPLSYQRQFVLVLRAEQEKN